MEQESTDNDNCCSQRQEIQDSLLCNKLPLNYVLLGKGPLLQASNAGLFKLKEGAKKDNLIIGTYLNYYSNSLLVAFQAETFVLV